MSLVVKFLGALLLVQFAVADYCTDQKLLCGSNKHIGCNNPGWNKNLCGSSPVQVKMTAEIKDALLLAHNEKRNLIASGNVTGLGPAVRMATMVWDDELSTLAELNTKQCTMVHDSCHNTISFRTSGQNLYYGGSKPNFQPVASQIKGAIEAWYREVKDATVANLAKLTTNQAGHFTQMVTAHSTHLGCGISQWTAADGWKNILISCNYAAPNMMGSPIFVKGPAASNCTQKNPSLKALCAVGEKINANAFDKVI